MECPNCKLVNPPGTVHCDCGYNFLTRTISAPAQQSEIAPNFGNIPAKSDGSVGLGIGFGLLLHLLQLLVVPGIAVLYGVLYPRTPYSGLAALLLSAYAWGLTQFLYLGPAIWLAYHKGQRETAKGFLIVAGVGVLLNGACDALVFRALSHRG
jgi:hypothetical protein